MPTQVYVYSVAHSYSEGLDSYRVRSHSPDLDMLDLVVEQPMTFEPHKDGEEVELTPIEEPFRALIDAAPDEVRTDFLSSLAFIPKATQADRVQVLEGLSEDELALSGLMRFKD